MAFGPLVSMAESVVPNMLPPGIPPMPSLVQATALAQFENKVGRMLESSMFGQMVAKKLKKVDEETYYAIKTPARSKKVSKTESSKKKPLQKEAKLADISSLLTSDTVHPKTPRAPPEQLVSVPPVMTESTKMEEVSQHTTVPTMSDISSQVNQVTPAYISDTKIPEIVASIGHIVTSVHHVLVSDPISSQPGSEDMKTTTSILEESKVSVALQDQGLPSDSEESQTAKFIALSSVLSSLRSKMNEPFHANTEPMSNSSEQTPNNFYENIVTPVDDTPRQKVKRTNPRPAIGSMMGIPPKLARPPHLKESSSMMLMETPQPSFFPPAKRPYITDESEYDGAEALEMLFKIIVDKRMKRESHETSEPLTGTWTENSRLEESQMSSDFVKSRGMLLNSKMGHLKEPERRWVMPEYTNNEESDATMQRQQRYVPSNNSMTVSFATSGAITPLKPILKHSEPFENLGHVITDNDSTRRNNSRPGIGSMMGVPPNLKKPYPISEYQTHTNTPTVFEEVCVQGEPIGRRPNQRPGLGSMMGTLPHLRRTTDESETEQGMTHTPSILQEVPTTWNPHGPHMNPRPGIGSMMGTVPNLKKATFSDSEQGSHHTPSLMHEVPTIGQPVGLSSNQRPGIGSVMGTLPKLKKPGNVTEPASGTSKTPTMFNDIHTLGQPVGTKLPPRAGIGAMMGTVPYLSQPAHDATSDLSLYQTPSAFSAVEIEGAPIEAYSSSSYETARSHHDPEVASAKPSEVSTGRTFTPLSSFSQTVSGAIQLHYAKPRYSPRPAIGSMMGTAPKLKQPDNASNATEYSRTPSMLQDIHLEHPGGTLLQANGRPGVNSMMGVEAEIYGSEGSQQYTQQTGMPSPFESLPRYSQIYPNSRPGIGAMMGVPPRLKQADTYSELDDPRSKTPSLVQDIHPQGKDMVGKISKAKPAIYSMMGMNSSQLVEPDGGRTPTVFEEVPVQPILKYAPPQKIAIQSMMGVPAAKRQPVSEMSSNFRTPSLVQDIHPQGQDIMQKISKAKPAINSMMGMNSSQLGEPDGGKTPTVFEDVPVRPILKYAPPQKIAIQSMMGVPAAKRQPVSEMSSNFRTPSLVQDIHPQGQDMVGKISKAKPAINSMMGTNSFEPLDPDGGKTPTVFEDVPVRPILKYAPPQKIAIQSMMGVPAAKRQPISEMSSNFRTPSLVQDIHLEKKPMGKQPNPRPAIGSMLGVPPSLPVDSQIDSESIGHTTPMFLHEVKTLGSKLKEKLKNSRPAIGSMMGVPPVQRHNLIDGSEPATPGRTPSTIEEILQNSGRTPLIFKSELDPVYLIPMVAYSDSESEMGNNMKNISQKPNASQNDMHLQIKEATGSGITIDDQHPATSTVSIYDPKTDSLVGIPAQPQYYLNHVPDQETLLRSHPKRIAPDDVDNFEIGLRKMSTSLAVLTSTHVQDSQNTPQAAGTQPQSNIINLSEVYSNERNTGSNWAVKKARQPTTEEEASSDADSSPSNPPTFFPKIEHGEEENTSAGFSADYVDLPQEMMHRKTSLLTSTLNKDPTNPPSFFPKIQKTDLTEPPTPTSDTATNEAISGTMHNVHHLIDNAFLDMEGLQISASETNNKEEKPSSTYNVPVDAAGTMVGFSPGLPHPKPDSGDVDTTRGSQPPSFFPNGELKVLQCVNIPDPDPVKLQQHRGNLSGMMLWREAESQHIISTHPDKSQKEDPKNMQMVYKTGQDQQSPKMSESVHKPVSLGPSPMALDGFKVKCKPTRKTRDDCCCQNVPCDKKNASEESAQLTVSAPARMQKDQLESQFKVQKSRPSSGQPDETSHCIQTSASQLMEPQQQQQQQPVSVKESEHNIIDTVMPETTTIPTPTDMKKSSATSHLLLDKPVQEDIKPTIINAEPATDSLTILPQNMVPVKNFTPDNLQDVEEYIEMEPFDIIESPDKNDALSQTRLSHTEETNTVTVLNEGISEAALTDTMATNADALAQNLPGKSATLLPPLREDVHSSRARHSDVIDPQHMLPIYIVDPDNQISPKADVFEQGTKSPGSAVKTSSSSQKSEVANEEAKQVLKQKHDSEVYKAVDEDAVDEIEEPGENKDSSEERNRFSSGIPSSSQVPGPKACNESHEGNINQQLAENPTWEPLDDKNVPHGSPDTSTTSTSAEGFSHRDIKEQMVSDPIKLGHAKVFGTLSAFKAPKYQDQTSEKENSDNVQQESNKAASMKTSVQKSLEKSPAMLAKSLESFANWNSSAAALQDHLATSTSRKSSADNLGLLGTTNTGKTGTQATKEMNIDGNPSSTLGQVSPIEYTAEQRPPQEPQDDETTATTTAMDSIVQAATNGLAVFNKLFQSLPVSRLSLPTCNAKCGLKKKPPISNNKDSTDGAESMGNIVTENQELSQATHNLPEMSQQALEKEMDPTTGDESSGVPKDEKTVKQLDNQLFKKINVKPESSVTSNHMNSQLTTDIHNRPGKIAYLSQGSSEGFASQGPSNSENSISSMPTSQNVDEYALQSPEGKKHSGFTPTSAVQQSTASQANQSVNVIFAPNSDMKSQTSGNQSVGIIDIPDKPAGDTKSRPSLNKSLSTPAAPGMTENVAQKSTKSAPVPLTLDASSNLGEKFEESSIHLTGLRVFGSEHLGPFINEPETPSTGGKNQVEYSKLHLEHPSVKKCSNSAADKTPSDARNSLKHSSSSFLGGPGGIEEVFPATAGLKNDMNPDSPTPPQSGLENKAAKKASKTHSKDCCKKHSMWENLSKAESDKAFKQTCICSDAAEEQHRMDMGMVQLSKSSSAPKAGFTGFMPKSAGEQTPSFAKSENAVHMGNSQSSVLRPLSTERLVSSAGEDEEEEEEEKLEIPQPAVPRLSAMFKDHPKFKPLFDAVEEAAIRKSKHSSSKHPLPAKVKAKNILIKSEAVGESAVHHVPRLSALGLRNILGPVDYGYLKDSESSESGFAESNSEIQGKARWLTQPFDKTTSKAKVAVFCAKRMEHKPGNLESLSDVPTDQSHHYRIIPEGIEQEVNIPIGDEDEKTADGAYSSSSSTFSNHMSS
ncbi:unnamed protein product [Notodromas monacha]|uniref:Uncharacterized protein n=1 Tax=Notodromas monacha TaxID=399045 RepID=A0A7R9BTX3_9CRUS|nr:unnamed protein product [Notodromas monacha]CAG0920630.1 unnamed protein product [Notodromas monacha]